MAYKIESLTVSTLSWVSGSSCKIFSLFQSPSPSSLTLCEVFQPLKVKNNHCLLRHCHFPLWPHNSQLKKTPNISFQWRPKWKVGSLISMLFNKRCRKHYFSPNTWREHIKCKLWELIIFILHKDYIVEYVIDFLEKSSFQSEMVCRMIVIMLPLITNTLRTLCKQCLQILVNKTHTIPSLKHTQFQV